MMDRREVFSDVSFMLLLVPLIASTSYALVLWAGQGFSLVIPENVYLNVTRSPAVFLVGILAVFLGTIIELSNEPLGTRAQTAVSLSKRLQSLAVATFVLAFVSAWYANGFRLDLTGAVVDLLAGRFNVLFPAMLFVLSFLLTTPISLGRTVRPRPLAFISLLLAPLLLYEIGKRNADLGLLVSLILIILGGYLLSRY